MLTKEKDEHFASIKNFDDDDDLWENVKDLMMI